jgi:hypothetical protein
VGLKNFRLLIKNDSDLATITAAAGTTLAATLPITNVQKYNNSRVARFTSVASSIIKGDFASSKLINSIIIWRHNLTSAATWRIKLYDGAGQTGTLLYDSGDIKALVSKALNELDWGIDPLGANIFDNFGRIYSVLWTPEIYKTRSFSIELKDPSNSFIDVARLYMGKYFSTEINAAYGMKNMWQDDTQQTRTSGASLWSDAAELYRKLDFDIKNLNEDDRVRAMDAFRTVSKISDFFISFFPESGGVKERDYSFAGKFVNNPDFNHDFYNNFSAPFQVEEA